MTWPTHTRSNLRRKSAAGTVQQRVFRSLKRGSRSKHEICELVGLPPTVVLAALWSLRQAGKVQMVGAGKCSRYQRVPNARAPKDTRGQHPRSRENLEPALPATLRERWMRARYGENYRPVAQPGIELERYWGRR